MAASNPPLRTSHRVATALGSTEAMRLLASIDHGRVVFTCNALPAVRLVNHLVDDGQVILRTRLYPTVSTTLRPLQRSSVIVAYEVDHVDLHARTGWSVVVTGNATTINDPERLTRYERLNPWVNLDSDSVLAITPQIVHGIRINAG
ncbi:pyridoxamine 5'-phosphate oxidase family protein [Mycobacterium sp. PDNC021]|uniref:pyridoxamine 5'-phosphate oxidase family protein n=1 Tax=Mycobacterium sp. PDNC021 TaxID=3391399 RepID=UPI003AAEE7AB